MINAEMTQVKYRSSAARKLAATQGRDFRTFLLVSQFEAQEIGARIALARKEAGLTQEQVADVATFSKRSLQDYEAGVTIPYKHLREIAGILARKPEWFLHGDEVITEDRLSVVEDRLAEALDRLRRVEALLRDGPPAHESERTRPH